MASTSEGYFGRAWGLLTRDKGWWKPVLLLALANFVPIVGPLGVFGYELEWARLTAWGVDSAPKQKGVRVGECISSGWRGFVTILGWMIAWGIVSAILSAVSLFGLLNLAVFVAGFFASTLLTVCAIRAAIYQRIGAGYQANRIADMVKADFEGVARVTGIHALSQMIIGLVAGMLSLMAFTPIFMQFAMVGARTGRAMTESQAMSLIMGAVSQAIPAVLVMAAICSILGTIASLVTTTAAALWVRNFDVPSWGNSEDPIPCLASAESVATPAPNPMASAAPPTAATAGPAVDPDASNATDVSAAAPAVVSAAADTPGLTDAEPQVGEKGPESTSVDKDETIEEISLTQPTPAPNEAPAEAPAEAIDAVPVASPADESVEEATEPPAEMVTESPAAPEPEVPKTGESDATVEDAAGLAPDKGEVEVVDDLAVDPAAEKDASSDETAGQESEEE